MTFQCANLPIRLIGCYVFKYRRLFNRGDLMYMCRLDCNIEQFEDTKGVIRNRNLMKDRQHSNKMKKNKRRNNKLQNTTQKTKDRAIQTLLKTVGELMWKEC